jgi:signal transduction histidine kinase
LGLFAAAGAAGYFVSRQILEDELGRSLSAIAAAAASQVSGERLLSIEPNDDLNQTRTYRSLHKLLSEIRTSSGARRIFAVDAQGRLRLDAGGNLPVGAQMPELSRDRSELARVLEGSPAASQVLFEGSDGSLYKTGYAPVFQGDRVVGAIGVEGSAAFFRPLARLSSTFLVLGAFALAVLTLAAALAARGLSRPLRRLMDSALRIGRGDLATPVSPEHTHELAVLAREVEVMRRHLESRTRQLQMMIAGVAHEVRNPMGGISLFAGLLSEQLQGESVSPEIREHVSRIQREVQYLERIVEDFLKFAREEPLARSPTEAEGLLEGVAAVVESEASQKGVSVRVQAAPAKLQLDANLVSAALVNLAKNAVQASPANSSVELTGSRVGESYRIQICDSGPGIEPEIEEKIFEPFFTTREKGTGLGLPLARKIIQAHQGDISVQSAPGRTVFTVALPLDTDRSNAT